MNSEPTNSLPLPIFCYRLAYFVLPQLLFADPQRIIARFTDESCPPELYFYVMGTVALETEVVTAEADQFQTHNGELNATHRYYILQYPTPPAFDLQSDAPVLAPHFSAIVERIDDENAVQYFVLGQNPNGVTTLRSLERDGVNANLGEGPEPKLEAFVKTLRAHFE